MGKKVFDYDVRDLCIIDLQGMFKRANIKWDYVDRIVQDWDPQDEVCMSVQPEDFIDAIEKTAKELPTRHPCKKIFNRYVKSAKSEDGDDFRTFLKEFQDYLNKIS